jgi:translation initiation factor IF-2
LAITVKDFAKTLKISDKALIDRMQKAGLSHSSASDEVTASDKQALLRFLKGTKTQSQSIKSDSGVTVTSKGKSSLSTASKKSYSDNIEAKRAAASEQLKEQQTKREEQLKAATKQKQEQKSKFAKKVEVKQNLKPVDVKDQLSSAVNAYKRKEGANFEDSKHQFEAPKEFIKKDIEVPNTIQVGELAKSMAVKGGEVVKN